MVKIFETKDEIHARILHDMLLANGVENDVIKEKFGRFRWDAVISYYITVDEENVQIAKALLEEKSVFDDLPWEPEADENI